jgi:hypothetical protein
MGKREGSLEEFGSERIADEGIKHMQRNTGICEMGGSAKQRKAVAVTSGGGDRMDDRLDRRCQAGSGTSRHSRRPARRPRGASIGGMARGL